MEAETTTTAPQPVKWPTLADVVRVHVLATCAACNWNITRAAARLGVAVKTVYNRLYEYEEAGHVYHDGSHWRAAA